MDSDNNQTMNPEIDNLIEKNYEFGFTTEIESARYEILAISLIFNLYRVFIL